MKISKIDIKNYYQFKDLSIDLTYPVGHQKAGKPLEKVCFIGQNGTGKTMILRLIKDFIYICKHKTNEQITEYESVPKKAELTVKFNINQKEYSLYVKENKLSDSGRTGFGNFINKIKRAYVNFPADMRHDIRFDETTGVDEGYNLDSCVDLNGANIKKIWQAIYQRIRLYQNKKANFKLKKVDELIAEEKSIDIVKEIKEWEEKNESPLHKIATSFLNELLFDFSLVVEENIKDVRNLDFIQIKRIGTDEIIPFEFLSTGTKQIVLSLVPLYSLNTKGSVILIDEPERSLFPNTQKKLINQYVDLAGSDTQLFFATHSPVIASQFEPWEIVELKFDENNELMQDKYYKGERSLENYFIQPKYLRWDSILGKLFDLELDGNPERQKRLFELSEIGVRLQEMKKQNNTYNNEHKKLWEEYKKIAESLDWKIDAE